MSHLIKYYIVEESGGEFDAQWSNAVGIYGSKELADTAINNAISNRKLLADQYPELHEKGKTEPRTNYEFWEKLRACDSASKETIFDITEFYLNAPIP